MFGLFGFLVNINIKMSFLNFKNVLIVEDIVDTGKTMVKLLETVNKFGPKQIKVCRLIIH